MRWPDTGLAWRPTSFYVSEFAAVEGYADNSLFSPLGVAIAPDGTVYVTDTAGLKAFRVLLPTSVLLMP